ELPVFNDLPEKSAVGRLNKLSSPKKLSSISVIFRKWWVLAGILSVPAINLINVVNENIKKNKIYKYIFTIAIPTAHMLSALAIKTKLNYMRQLNAVLDEFEENIKKSNKDASEEYFFK